MAHDHYGSFASEYAAAAVEAEKPAMDTKIPKTTNGKQVLVTVLKKLLQVYVSRSLEI